MWMAVKECGAPAFLTMLVAVVALALAAGAILASALRVRVAKAIAIGALGFAMLPALVGIAGTMLGRRKVEAALASGAIDPDAIDPEMIARIRVEGEKEAAQCTTIGGTASALPLLLSIGALVLAFALKPKVATAR